MKAALTTKRTLFNGTQAMMIERSSSLAAICTHGRLCIEDEFIDVLEVQHVS